jgi:hypothetical protein
VRIVNVKLGNLALGHWRNLTPAELQGLVPKRGAHTPVPVSGDPRPMRSREAARRRS